MGHIYFFYILSNHISDKVTAISPMTFSNAFLNEIVWIVIKIALKFPPKISVNNILPLVLIMARRRPVDNTWSESTMIRLLTHICVTRPEWVNEVLCPSCDRKPYHILSAAICMCPIVMLSHSMDPGKFCSAREKIYNPGDRFRRLFSWPLPKTNNL